MINGIEKNNLAKLFFYATIITSLFYCSKKNSDATALIKSLATVQTIGVTNITTSTAKVSAHILSTGGSSLRLSGLIYSNQVITDTNSVIGGGRIDYYFAADTGTYHFSVLNLLPNTTYHIRAFVVNDMGISYGDDLSFTTLNTPTPSIPIINTMPIDVVNYTSAVCNGNILSNGNSPILEKGFVYSTNHNPTILDNKKTINDINGIFSDTIQSLISTTTYYARAYAINGVGIGYGNEVEFKTIPLSNNSCDYHIVYGQQFDFVLNQGNLIYNPTKVSFITNSLILPQGVDMYLLVDSLVGTPWCTLGNLYKGALLKVSTGSGFQFASGSQQDILYYKLKLQGLTFDSTFYCRYTKSYAVGNTTSGALYSTETQYGLSSTK